VSAPLSDAEIGEEVRAFRDAAGMSQQELATRMKDCGFTWAQATVWAVESGNRSLRWSEGVVLGQLIGFGTSPENSEVVRDAIAYRRILEVVGSREANAQQTQVGAA
tara:strand:+ start:336 stop:656 length:321 start_codon:yes stop_codon:yes gene_type:complete